MAELKHISELLPQSLNQHGIRVATVFFDGACEVNPGGVATAGFVVLDNNGTEIHAGSDFVCEGEKATNNVAEYFALEHALRWCLKNPERLKLFGCNTLSVCGDSQLVVKQIKGEWNCNKLHLQILRDRCLEIIKELQAKDIAVAVNWIKRDQNERADELSRAAYVKHTGKKFPERRRA